MLRGDSNTKPVVLMLKGDSNIKPVVIILSGGGGGILTQT